MDLKLEWKSPIEVEPEELPGTIANIALSGIKLFLHQRNQIPVPLEQLRRTVPKKGQVFSKTDGNAQSGSDVDIGDCDDLRQRIQSKIKERRRVRDQKRKSRETEKAIRKEDAAFTAITECLKILEHHVQKSLRSIVVVGLFFGTNVYTAKEIIFFDFSKLTWETGKLVGENVKGKNQKGEDKEQQYATLLRSFYKTVIMSEEFCVLTDKNLPSTGSHICLISKEKLECEETNSVILVERCSFFTEHMSWDNETVKSDNSDCLLKIDESFEISKSSTSEVQMHTRPKKKQKKVLRIEIDVPARGPIQNERKVLEGTLNEPLFCYQIPLRLKGIISCKNNLT